MSLIKKEDEKKNSKGSRRKCANGENYQFVNASTLCYEGIHAHPETSPGFLKSLWIAFKP